MIVPLPLIILVPPVISSVAPDSIVVCVSILKETELPPNFMLPQNFVEASNTAFSKLLLSPLEQKLSALITQSWHENVPLARTAFT